MIYTYMAGVVGGIYVLEFFRVGEMMGCFPDLSPTYHGTMGMTDAHSNGKKETTIGEFLCRNSQEGRSQSTWLFCPSHTARLYPGATIGKGLVLHENSFS